MSNATSLEAKGRRRWLAHMREDYRRWQQNSRRRRLLDTVVYLLPFVLFGGVYYRWGDTWLSPGIRDFLSRYHRLTMLIGLLLMYLFGLMFRDMLRYHFRMFAAPIICNAVFLFALL